MRIATSILINSVEKLILNSFNRIKEALRDKTTGNLCSALHTIGLEARSVERSRIRAIIGPGIFRIGIASKGLIEIASSPIQWVAVDEIDTGSNENPISVAITRYGIPDTRHLPAFKIELVHIKSFPIFGRTLGMRWKGKDCSTGIIHHLNLEIETKSMLEHHQDRIYISTFNDSSCWVITCYNQLTLSRSQWVDYENIASILLKTPLTN